MSIENSLNPSKINNNLFSKKNAKSTIDSMGKESIKVMKKAGHFAKGEFGSRIVHNKNVGDTTISLVCQAANLTEKLSDSKKVKKAVESINTSAKFIGDAESRYKNLKSTYKNGVLVHHAVMTHTAANVAIVAHPLVGSAIGLAVAPLFLESENENAINNIDFFNLHHSNSLKKRKKDVIKHLKKNENIGTPNAKETALSFFVYRDKKKSDGLSVEEFNTVFKTYDDTFKKIKDSGGKIKEDQNKKIMSTIHGFKSDFLKKVEKEVKPKKRKEVIEKNSATIRSATQNLNSITAWKGHENATVIEGNTTIIDDYAK